MFLCEFARPAPGLKRCLSTKGLTSGGRYANNISGPLWLPSVPDVGMNGGGIGVVSVKNREAPGAGVFLGDLETDPERSERSGTQASSGAGLLPGQSRQDCGSGSAALRGGAFFRQRKGKA